MASTIAPTFFATCEDSGCLPIVSDVSNLKEGNIIALMPYDGRVVRDSVTVSTFDASPKLGRPVLG